EKLIEWKNANGLPRRVVFVAGDNKLLVDFNSTMSVKAFFSEISQLTNVVFEEFIECDGVLTDNQGNNFQNEFIVPLIRHQL
ncbi:MAG: hypothetical protein IJM66_03225, partial [Muribaculaceae bacterium]|nr:hypothetical protein [Muribaculaceae bacterium]